MKIIKTKKYSQMQVKDSRFTTYDELIEIGGQPTLPKKGKQSTLPKKNKKRNEEPLHSLDIHCDGEDDGY